MVLVGTGRLTNVDLVVLLVQRVGVLMIDVQIVGDHLVHPIIGIHVLGIRFPIGKIIRLGLMPTETQKKTFNIRTEKLKDGKKVIMGKVMREGGYSEETSKHPGVLTNSKGWLELIAEYDPEPVVKNVYDIAKGDDKRSVLPAARLFFEITGRLNTKIELDINKQREDFFD